MKVKCLACGHVGNAKIERGILADLVGLMISIPGYILSRPLLGRKPELMLCRNCGSSVVAEQEAENVAA